MKKPEFKLKAWGRMLERELEHRQALLKEGQDYLLRVRTEARFTRESMQRASAEFGKDPTQQRYLVDLDLDHPELPWACDPVPTP